MSRRHHKRRTRPFLIGTGVLIVAVLWPLAGWISRTSAYAPPYEVLERTDSYEVRRYQERAVAQIVIDDSLERAFEQATDALHAYRSGRNLKVPTESSSALSDTTERSATFRRAWPFFVEERLGEVLVSMILPPSITVKTAPRPNDPRIRIDVLESQRIAVRRVGSGIDAGPIVREQQLLLSDLKDSSLLILSEPRFAYYGPPWAPSFLRYGEVHVRVR